MKCPCGQGELNADAFHAYATRNREAILRAMAVKKAPEHFGSVGLKRTPNGGIVLAPLHECLDEPKRAGLLAKLARMLR